MILTTDNQKSPCFFDEKNYPTRRINPTLTSNVHHLDLSWVIYLEGSQMISCKNAGSVPSATCRGRTMGGSHQTVANASETSVTLHQSWVG